MLAVILRFIVPIIAFYFLQKWIRTLLKDLNGRVDGESQAKKDVIDLCPECGRVTTGCCCS